MEGKKKEMKKRGNRQGKAKNASTRDKRRKRKIQRKGKKTEEEHPKTKKSFFPPKLVTNRPHTVHNELLLKWNQQQQKKIHETSHTHTHWHTHTPILELSRVTHHS
jgi:hypothetical protein